ncbi:hypothetical protein [Lactiplantibacillus plantarum]|uniref:hypothetical protein n=1 Tax=Lactiplantibacillus plantarum TaxID=1590 RepID=UPI001BAD22EB|nr:hypothetical protein [Lactiplantibacillus plantarum]MBS0937546.1 hypothetical protein [Lactiplantibacillus plantarum]MBS0944132.1 hypothetical protein [Lactiplantibacillus plantarum]
MSTKKKIGYTLAILGGISMILVSKLAGHSATTTILIIIFNSVAYFGFGLQF